MRTFITCLVLVLIALVAPVATMQASTEVSAAESRAMLINKVVEKKADFLMEKSVNSKSMKRALKMAKFLGLGDGNKVDFQTEPDKWMWFWIFGWGLAIILSILGVFIPFIYWIGYLCGLAGTVCLVIWLLKKFGGM
jgi:hypothetical protein